MTTETTFITDERAVSDVVGYVLIFSLIIATVGIVTTVGFSTLEDRQDAEQINNAERAFDVFATNVEDVYRGGAPTRATEMRLAGGTLQHGEPVTVTVQDAANPNINHTMELSPLVYTEGETAIVYTGGAIVRSESRGSAILREPPFVLGTDRSMLPFVTTTQSVGSTAISRQGTIKIESRQTNVNATTRSAIADGGELKLVVDSPRQKAWDQYLNSEAERVDDWEYYEANSTLAFETDEMAVPRFRVRIMFN